MRSILASMLLLAFLLPAMRGDNCPLKLRKHPDVLLIEQFDGSVFSEFGVPGSVFVQDALTRLFPERESNDGPCDRTPAYVWKFGPGESQNHLILERDWIETIPGTTNVRLTLVNDAGLLVSEAKFELGGRTWFSKASLKPVAGIEFPAIVIDGNSWGGDNPKEFYALIDGRFDLIRFEDGKGTAKRNHCFTNSSGCDPAPPEQSARQWEADVLSGDRARVLRALIWLGAVHDWRPGKARKVGLVSKVRVRPSVVAKLHELAMNGEAWEREAAKLVLRADDND